MKRSVAVIVLLLLTGCGLLPKVQDETSGWSAQRLYSTAQSKMNDSSYEDAIKYFEKLEARYPYGRYAQQAQLEIAYAYYKDDEPISALAASNRFIRLHPDHPHVDYVYYLKGVINFNANLGLLSHLGLGSKSLADRDPKAARESFAAFKALVTRFPHSKYTPDALARMRYLANTLAAHEIAVARYYMRRSAYLAAVNRAQGVIKTYPHTPAVEQALIIMTDGYKAMGMTKLQHDAVRVLKLNFPHSTYLTHANTQANAWWKLW